jgi:CheY-like chemotaxis protein
MMRRRVLLVDDEPLIAMLVEGWLRDLGCDPILARSVEQALRVVESDCPDAAILDVSLGADNSYPVADALTARNVPFAFATGRESQAIPPPHDGIPLLAEPYGMDALREMMKGLCPGQIVD